MQLARGIKDWLRGPDYGMWGRMNQFQYSAHSGTYPHEGDWYGKPTSGSQLWPWILQNSKLYAIPMCEADLLRKIAREIGDYVPENCPIIDLGIGGEYAVRNKLAPIAKAVNAKRVVLVDGSSDFLNEAHQAMRGLTSVAITKVLDDFLSAENAQYVDHAALVTYTGSTVGNIDADQMASIPPMVELTEHLERVLHKSHGGYALITFDSCLNESANKAAYEEHTPFHLNFIDQAVAECGFPADVRWCMEYRARPKTWYTNEKTRHPIAGAVSHYAEFTTDASFEFAGEKFEICKGQAFLIENSFKYTEEFFSNCVEAADGQVVASWTQGSIIGVLIKAASPMDEFVPVSSMLLRSAAGR